MWNWYLFHACPEFCFEHVKLVCDDKSISVHRVIPTSVETLQLTRGRCVLCGHRLLLAPVLQDFVAPPQPRRPFSRVSPLHVDVVNLVLLRVIVNLCIAMITIAEFSCKKIDQQRSVLEYFTASIVHPSHTAEVVAFDVFPASTEAVTFVTILQAFLPNTVSVPCRPCRSR